MATIGKLSIILAANTVRLVHDLQEGSIEVDRFTEHVEQSETKLDRLGQTASSTAAKVLGFATAGAGLGFGLKLAADFEQAQIAFEVMLGSADRAKQVMGDLQRFAAETPFELPGIVEASRKLLAFGTHQSELISTLRALGDVASARGAPLNELAEIYGKNRVQGRLFAMDINQLMNRGIPIVQELAKQFGVTESAVKKLVETGQVNFKHLEKAIFAMSGAGGQFQNMMQRQSQSLWGLFSTLKDGVGAVMRDVGNSFANAAGAADLMRTLTSAVNDLAGPLRAVATISGYIVGWLGKMIAGFMRWSKTFTLVITAVVVFKTVISMLLTVALALIAAKVAWWALNTVAAWMKISGAALLYRAAIVGLWLAKKALIAAQIVWMALSGPQSWLVLAGAVAAATAAVAGVAYAMRDTADAAKGVAQGHQELTDSLSDYPAEAVQKYNDELARLRDHYYVTNQISEQQYDNGMRVAQSALEQAKRVAELKVEEDRLAAVREAALKIIEDAEPAAKKQLQLIEQLQQAYDQGAITHLEYLHTAERINDALNKSDAGAQLIMSLQEQINTFKMSAQEADYYKARLEGMLNPALFESQYAQLSQTLQSLKQQKIGDDLVAGLKEQIATFGMTTAQIDIYKASLQGATSASLDEARNMAAKLDLLEKEKKQREDIARMEQDAARKRMDEQKRLVESLKTPLDIYQEQINMLDELMFAQEITEEQAGLGRLQALKKLHDSVSESTSKHPAALERGTQAALKAEFGDTSLKTEKEILREAQAQRQLQEEMLKALQAGGGLALARLK